MPLLASFLFFLEPTPETEPTVAPPAAAEAPQQERAKRVWRDPFTPIRTNTPRRIGMVLGEDGPRALLEGPDGNIYVGALLSDNAPTADRTVLDTRLSMLLGAP